MQGLASDRFLKKFAGKRKKRHQLPASESTNSKPDDEAGNIGTDNHAISSISGQKVVDHDPEDHSIVGNCGPLNDAGKTS
jgi:hypothetical protein